MINRVEIIIIGKNPDYLLKEIIKRNINIYNLDKTSKDIRLIIDYKDYLIIKKMKTTYKIKIINRYGLSKIKYIR